MKVQITVPCIYVIIAVLALKFLLLTLSNPARGFALAEPLHVYQPIADNVEMFAEFIDRSRLRVTIENNWPDANVYLLHAPVYTLEFFSRGNWYMYPTLIPLLVPLYGFQISPSRPSIGYFSIVSYYPLVVPGLYRVRFSVSDSEAHYTNPNAYRNRHDLVAEIFITG